MSNPVFNFVSSLFQIKQEQTWLKFALKTQSAVLDKLTIELSEIKQELTNTQNELYELARDTNQTAEILAQALADSIVQETEPYYVIPVSRVKDIKGKENEQK